MTQPSDADVTEYLARVEPAGRREDAVLLDRIFREETGFKPVLWGTSIIGYGRYDYTYATGHSGQTLATGFAPRKANMVVYIMPGYGEFADILDDLGRHKLGKSCLYLGRLSGVNEDALRRLIRAGLKDLATRWPIQPT
ncbi:DUF1801 domain-containing protein [Fluviibacterium sp. DFM31]|uniref:DUF1801 domain-containing protein n=1 Tax=Meridianimarinicoccus marinus TaxID=3231483 RepID=A0ABV3L3N8_9RHOB